MSCLSNWAVHAIALAVVGQLQFTRVLFPTYFVNIMVVSTFSETSHWNFVYLAKPFVLRNCSNIYYNFNFNNW